ncbi:multi-sensor signal transduction histidine kinase [Rhodopirellula maiorica SM1]|uniref:histidine kinase n=1 Tax=Rhodopirellula maiorica SM1 TaxID=1265738 RepID=M5RBR7_9BACT|nr:ATP-binding protein [Rhodopirellula maiorica]EMI16516.1 multi-sensor signal transduction histidine kinase [Rhodopirellula maiorica SM1]
MDYPFRILIIEDNPDTRANLRDILELDGHEVVVASSFDESRAVARTNKVGLVITDRRLPEGMIEEFLPEVKEDSANADIIVVTGFGDMQSTIAALRLGVTDYVIKPIIPDDIRSIVKRIAEKKRLQAELAEEHYFTNEVLRTVEAIVLVLDLDGNVIRFNPYFQQLSGWTQADLKGLDWFAHCVPEHERDRVKEVFVATSRLENTRGIVNDVLGKDGRSHRIRWSNTILKSSEGTAEAVLAVGVDVSDLVEAQSRALQAERLAAIGQTMTALSHESRNALQRIKAASDVLSLEIAGNKNAEDDLHAIQRASSDLQCLLEEVRSFAAPIQVHCHATSLDHVWRRAWSDIATVRQGRDAGLAASCDSENLEIEIDTVRMEQVFRNLFENSLAACHDPVRIQIDFCSLNDDVEFKVTDNGPGLNPDQQQKLFEPFYTTKRTGTGLGMSICQRIIEAHGGTIRVEPCSSGACVAIRMPRHACPDLLNPSQFASLE